MTVHRCASLGFYLLILAVAAFPALAQELTEFSAYYEASTNGIKGHAERHLIHQEDDRYRLNISLEAQVAGVNIGDLEQASEFIFSDDLIQPQLYSYQVSGVSSDVESVSFNWDAGIALSADEEQSWSLELSGPVLDQLSYQLALALDVARDSEREVFDYAIVDGAEIETHQFRVLGEEIVTTPIGPLRCVKLERVRENQNGRSTQFWLALDWDNLLVKIVQQNPSGLQIDLELKMALVGGVEVSPLK